ncbi:MAG: RNA polymerase sigma factor [Candidatus Kapabacteria bacterium]|nr:RNA polymerase sigma factor [Candidatus Kapabacteria bacterium]
MNNTHEEFINVFEPVRERLWRFIRAMVFKYEKGGGYETARDIMSDTVLHALEEFTSLRDKQAFLSYCFTVASRLYKAQFVRRKFWGVYEEEIAANITDGGTPPDLGMDVHLLYKALETLPPAMREATVLFEISGLSLAEIQQIQGGSLSGVKSRIARARTRLVQLLGEHNVTVNTLNEPEEIQSGNEPMNNESHIISNQQSIGRTSS